MLITNEDLHRFHTLTKGPESKTSDEKIHEPIKIRTLFFSDPHLFAKGAEAPALVRMFNHLEPTASVYIVGDFLDGWSHGVRTMEDIGRLFPAKRKKSEKIPQSHIDPIQKLMRFGRKDVMIYLIPGNHDKFLRYFVPSFSGFTEDDVRACLTFAAAGAEVTGRSAGIDAAFEALSNILTIGNICIVPEIIHVTADGKRLLVRHGDEFDAVVKNFEWLSVQATWLRDTVFDASEWFKRNEQNWFVRTAGRRLFGLSENFSLADYIHLHKNQRDLNLPQVAKDFIRSRNELNQTKMHGIILGHNHIPELDIGQLIYGNCGDWMNPQHCTAIIEHLDGRLELVRWDDKRGIVPFYPETPSTRPTSIAKAGMPVPAG